MSGPGKAVHGAKRILHLNSPAPILRIIEKFCESKEIKIDSTESESLAFHFALVRRYNLILIGLQIPKVNPVRILKGLARAGNLTPALLISEAPSRDEAKFSSLPNVVGIIAKPIDIKVLSTYLLEARKPKELEPEEMKKLMGVLRKWEVGLKVEN